MENKEKKEVSEMVEYRNHKEMNYCESYYQEIKNDIVFKKINLPAGEYKKYISENLTKFVNHIENFERDKRAGNLNENGLIVLRSYYETLPLWKKAYNEINNQAPGQSFDKIKWKGTPSQFGYLFLQLVEKGYIEPPLYNGDPNFTGLSRLCFQFFDIETTPGNLTKEMTPGTPKKGNDKNTLSQTKRAKFTIPNLSDLA